MAEFNGLSLLMIAFLAGFLVFLKTDKDEHEQSSE